MFTKVYFIENLTKTLTSKAVCYSGTQPCVTIPEMNNIAIDKYIAI